MNCPVNTDQPGCSHIGTCIGFIVASVCTWRPRPKAKIPIVIVGFLVNVGSKRVIPPAIASIMGTPDEQWIVVDVAPSGWNPIITRGIVLDTAVNYLPPTLVGYLCRLLCPAAITVIPEDTVVELANTPIDVYSSTKSCLYIVSLGKIPAQRAVCENYAAVILIAAYPSPSARGIADEYAVNELGYSCDEHAAAS
jgi:hypothetical protein